MTRVRADEQDGFIEVLRNWLNHQPWFPATQGRWTLRRTDGMRLPVPEGDRDPQLNLEVHLFDVEHSGGRHRVSVPVALRSRPSAHVGKNVLIGKLRAAEGHELWLYDGTRDRAFLASWLEMARRGQGSRNGRCHGRPHAGFAGWEPFTTWLSRAAIEGDSTRSSRTLVAPPGVEPEADASRKVLVEFNRVLSFERSDAVDTAVTLSGSGGSSISGVLATITATDPEMGVSDLSIVREGSLAAPSAADVLADRSAGRTPEEVLEGIGEALARFHQDLAGSFGSHPQSTEQAEEAVRILRDDIEHRWSAAARHVGPEESARIEALVTDVQAGLDGRATPLSLQRIHGGPTLDDVHWDSRAERWIVDERSGMLDHQTVLQDLTSVLVSSAQRGTDLPGMTDEGADESYDVANSSAERFGALADALLRGYRQADDDSGVPDAARLRGMVLAEALDGYPNEGSVWLLRWIESLSS